MIFKFFTQYTIQIPTMWIAGILFLQNFNVLWKLYAGQGLKNINGRYVQNIDLNVWAYNKYLAHNKHLKNSTI